MKNLKKHVQIIGHLVREPKVTLFNNGKKLVSFDLATSSVSRKDGKILKTVQYHKVVAWDKTADVVEKNLYTGTEVIIEGYIESRKHRDENDRLRKISEIIVESLLYRNINHSISSKKNKTKRA